MEKTLIFGHKNPDTDSILSSIAMANLENKLGKNTEPCRIGNVNKETKYVLNYLNLQEPRLIESIEPGQNVIMVDHNSFVQSVEGIDKANILKVVDHHNISGFETGYPLYYRAEPVGCTATILYKMYIENNIEIDKTTAILLLSAIVSDTLLFKSPTCTDEDKEIAKGLAILAGIDIETYGMDMLKAGTDLSDYSSEELINIDAKEFMLGNKVKAIVSQVSTANIPEILERKTEIENAINSEISNKNLELYVLAITDIINSNSQAIVLGNRTDIFEKAYSVTLENNSAFLPGVVSRKKQIIPVLTDNV